LDEQIVEGVREQTNGVSTKSSHGWV